MKVTTYGNRRNKTTLWKINKNENKYDENTLYPKNIFEVHFQKYKFILKTPFKDFKSNAPILSIGQTTGEDKPPCPGDDLLCQVPIKENRRKIHIMLFDAMIHLYYIVSIFEHYYEHNPTV